MHHTEREARAIPVVFCRDAQLGAAETIAVRDEEIGHVRGGGFRDGELEDDGAAAVRELGGYAGVVGDGGDVVPDVRPVGGGRLRGTEGKCGNRRGEKQTFHVSMLL